jgi:prephenate dehydrogenase
MPNSSDVAIIGAGQYGLSLAAHLRAKGVEHRIAGDPVQLPGRDSLRGGLKNRKLII